jgi:DNA-directed RNA polymerase specialized sigma24 family protein
MTATPVRAADADLAGDAATGDVGAYASLYHRHIEAAWRLAQATAASAGAAAKATTNAFVSVVSMAGRGRDDVADQFRLHLLTAVYRDAYRGSDQPPAPRKSKRAGSAEKEAAPGNGGPLLINAFAKLPCRWRAALWLQEVEGLPATSAGPILGVSSAAAVQLNKRALAGLEYRVLQAGGSLPLPDLAPTLAAMVAPVPAEVQARTEARWKKAVGRDRRRAAPVAAWMSQRAPGPLAVCAVGLCAVGIIGLAVVGQGTNGSRGVPTGPVASGAPVSGTDGGSGSFGLTNPANPNPSATSGGSGTFAASASAPAAAAAANRGPHLVATTPTTSAPVVVTVPTTVPLVVRTVPTGAPVTRPPITLPLVPLPPVTTPPAPTPVAAVTPVLQVGLNTGVLAANVGVGPGACTGVQLLSLKVGCTGGPAGLSLGGTLLGGK